MNDLYLNIYGSVIYKNFMWGVREEEYELFKIDIRTGEVFFVKSFKEISRTGENRFINSIVEYNGKLILIPGTSRKFVTFDVDSGETNFYDYQGNDVEYDSMMFNRYNVYARYGEKLYLFPGKGKDILCLHMDTMDMEYISAPILEYIEKYGDYRLLFVSSYHYNENVWLPCFEKNMILKMNLKSLEYEWIQVNAKGENEGYISCTGNQETIFLAANNRELLKYDISTREITPSSNMDGLGAIFSYENKIWIIPKDSRDIELYDFESNQLKKYADIDGLSFQINLDKNVYTRMIENEKDLYIVPRFMNGLIRIDYLTGNVSLIKFQFPSTELNRSYFMQNLKLNGGEMFRGESQRLKMLLDYIIETQLNEKMEISKADIGEIIYKCIS